MKTQARHALLVLAVLATTSAQTSSAGIIFSTDFEDVADWTAPRGDGTLGFPNTWSKKATGPKYGPPKKNDGSWMHPSSWFRSAPTQISTSQGPMATIGAGQGRNGTRGMTYNVEVGFTFPAGVGWTGGSPLTMHLGDAGYHEMYVAMWLKYDSAWTWLHNPLFSSAGVPQPEGSQNVAGAQQKLVFISRLNEVLTASSAADNHSNGPLHPSWLPHWFNFLTSKPYFAYYANRSHQSNGILVSYVDKNDLWTKKPEYYPDYDRDNGPYKWPDNGVTDGVDGFIHSDGQWHHYEYHVKMNSAPGVADGVQEAWLDGRKKFSKTDMPFVLTGGSVSRGFNYVELFDNAYVLSHLYTDNVVYPIYIDDVVISTSYVGPGLPPDAPAAPVNLRLSRP